MKKILGFVFSCIAAICLTTAAMMTWQHASTEDAYQQLSMEKTSDDNGDQASRSNRETAIDWTELQRQNREVVGWLSVEGTSIDYPVVQTTDGTPAGFYLDHDFWKAPNSSGCPYLDQRTHPEGSHIMIFGHQIGSSGQMFTALRRAWDDNVFQAIGELQWSTPRGSERFKPLCALKVDQHFKPIQSFSFDGRASLREWLREVEHHAAARANNSEELIENAARVTTLVTCSSPIPGTEERTLVLFSTTT